MSDSCPECGSSERFYPNGAAYWCEHCQLEYSLDGDVWWAYDETGEMERV